MVLVQHTLSSAQEPFYSQRSPPNNILCWQKRRSVSFPYEIWTFTNELVHYIAYNEKEKNYRQKGLTFAHGAKSF